MKIHGRKDNWLLNFSSQLNRAKNYMANFFLLDQCKNENYLIQYKN